MAPDQRFLSVQVNNQQSQQVHFQLCLVDRTTLQMENTITSTTAINAATSGPALVEYIIFLYDPILENHTFWHTSIIKTKMNCRVVVYLVLKFYPNAMKQSKGMADLLSKNNYLSIDSDQAGKMVTNYFVDKDFHSYHLKWIKSDQVDK